MAVETPLEPLQPWSEIAEIRIRNLAERPSPERTVGLEESLRFYASLIDKYESGARTAAIAAAHIQMPPF